ncbi:hypothetical protein ECE50_015405 [Chitinophaga sp. Mgbs1]|uniref:Uncharacterized protein n=1 Tax=Chitinophaga solisilvae TaxID=1233460 RepID=A0A9Q5CZZ9_9BACT|nr:hypothetical protein [Chitinophaga solisilvae]
MNKALQTAARIAVMAGVTLVASQASAQLKVGNNPTVMNKSAVLELESTRQGLLLPRLTDTSAINGLTPPDGMIIFLNSPTGRGMYVRKDGGWSNISNGWGLKGNEVDPMTDFIGSTNPAPLIFKTNGAQRLEMTASGQFKVSTTSFPASTTELDVVILGTDGTLRQRKLNNAAFGDLVKSFNGLTGDVVFNTAASTGQNDANITTAGTTQTLNLPIMNGGASQLYGFLTLADWKKIQALNGLKIEDFITGVAAADAKRGAKLEYDNVNNTYSLKMIAADATNAGIVTTDAQSFAGAKTFKALTTFEKGINITADGATVKGLTSLETLKASGTSDLTGDVTLGGLLKFTTAPADAPVLPSYDVLLTNAGTVQKKTLNSAAFDGAIQEITDGTASVKESKIKFLTDNKGNDFKIALDAATGNNSVTFNLPDADATASAEKRGVVSTGAQSFAGAKNFRDNVAVGKLTATTSTLDVAGSVAMSIRTVTGTETLGDKDNTILAEGNAVIILPKAAAANLGRIYTIKKISGDIDLPVTIKGGGSNIEGSAADYVIYNDWTFVTLQSSGSAWYIIRK